MTVQNQRKQKQRLKKMAKVLLPVEEVEVPSTQKLGKSTGTAHVLEEWLTDLVDQNSGRHSLALYSLKPNRRVSTV